MPSIPFLSLHHQHVSEAKRMTDVFKAVLEKGMFVLGEEVSKFENEYAAFHQSKYCVAVGNGHDAIVVSLKALGVGTGDDVIVPSHTCQATWLAVLNSGANPVAVEIDPSTYTIDSSIIETAITRKTKAIVPVHLYGQPCDMDKIMTIAKKSKLVVIEDNAQAHGAVFKKKITGSWGHCNATSFYPTKNLAALGDGGAITTNEKKVFEFAQAFRNYGSRKKDVHITQGINSRLDELQAAILRRKLKKLNQWNELRRQNATLYFERLRDFGDIQLPPGEGAKVTPVFHQFVIQARDRDKLKNFLLRKGIETAIHYPTPVHLQKAFSSLGYKKGSLPIAEKIAKTVLSLPIWPGLTVNEVDRVCDAIRKFFQ